MAWLIAIYRSFRSIVTGVNVNSELAGAQDFVHVFACERGSQNQIWLRENFAPQHLFVDVRWLGVPAAFSQITNSVVPAPVVAAAIAGASYMELSTQTIIAKLDLL